MHRAIYRTIDYLVSCLKPSMENSCGYPYELHKPGAILSDIVVNRQKAGPDNGKE